MTLSIRRLASVVVLAGILALPIIDWGNPGCDDYAPRVSIEK